MAHHKLSHAEEVKGGENAHSHHKKKEMTKHKKETKKPAHKKAPAKHHHKEK